MKIRLLALLVLVLMQNNCMKTKTPEIKSPCVAIDSIDPINNPCNRRPANIWLG